MNFYDADWKQVYTAPHNFKDLSAIAYDDMSDTIYFNAIRQDAGTIVSLKLSHDKTKIPSFDTIVERTDHGCIKGMAFDPLDRQLYWTDSCNRTIFQKAMGDDGAGAKNGTVWMRLANEDQPMGISLDVCRRKVYWTNWAAKTTHSSTVKRASMTGDSVESEVIITTAGIPNGVAVDQFSKRLFWVDDPQGDDFHVSSSAFDGTDRRTVVNATLNDPVNLAVDREFVYWTDMTHRTIWRAKKDGSNQWNPERVPHNFTQTPNGVILRSSLLSAQANNEDCSSTIAAMKAKSKSTREATITTVTPANYQVVPFCLNPLKDMAPSDRCVCAPGFVGVHCERSLCHNFCVHGSCEVDSTGNPRCECSKGYEGARCDQDVCSGFCLNGRCSVVNAKPVCSCEDSFYGLHCEHRELPAVCFEWCDTKDDSKYGHDLVKLCK